MRRLLQIATVQSFLGRAFDLFALFKLRPSKQLSKVPLFCFLVK